MRRECPVCRTLQPSTVRDSREKEEWEEPGGAMIGSHLQNGAETVFFLSPLTSGVLPLESAASRSAPLSSSNRAISLRAVVGDRACARGLKHRKRGVGRRAGQIYLCVWGGSDDEGAYYWVIRERRRPRVSDSFECGSDQYNILPTHNCIRRKEGQVVLAWAYWHLRVRASEHMLGRELGHSSHR